MTSSLARSASRRATVRAMLLVLTGAIGVQASAAIAIGLFDQLGVLGTSSVRMAFAAVLLLIVFRPRLRGRSRADWLGIVLYGVAMAAMNAFLYLAFARLPIGIATTIDFLGPCLVALAASRRPREGLLALAAILGVGMIAGLGGPFDPLGILFAALAGASFGGYTLLAARVGQSEGGLASMSLSVVVAAILTLPFSVPAVPLLRPEHLLTLLLSALLGTALAFTVDTMAGRLTSARVLGVFFAFDPVVGTVIGAVFLGQLLPPVAVLGVVLVVAAGAGIVWSAGERGRGADPDPDPDPGPDPDSGPDPGPDPGSYAGTVSEHEGSGSGARESLEIERKYEARFGAELPSAGRLREAGFAAEAPLSFSLRAQYLDTPGEELAAQGVAVRERHGGSDAGWHLKQRGPEGVRELHWPAADRMPEGLREEIRARIGDAADAVRPLARIDTERTVVLLRDATGAAVVELADDRVLAADAAGVRRAWREWEAELVPGADPALLERVEPLLLEAGAEPSLSAAKIARATGRLVELAERQGADAAVLAALRELDASDREAARRLGS